MSRCEPTGDDQVAGLKPSVDARQFSGEANERVQWVAIRVSAHAMVQRLRSVGQPDAHGVERH
ncbi:MAG: hypothetical protein Q8Q84_13165, partial [Hydrogenophaga sp.]|nr:hypothetical protein [Hydrogenophaga sp.]